MPVFGDYETVGEPVAITEERGHVSTVWQARKSAGENARKFAIKCFAPHRHPAKQGLPGDALDQDRGLEFLESVKQLKQACGKGGCYFIPIHAFGVALAGAWYVTDFYPRSLKSWITLRGRLDRGALQHVVGSIVTGCLALKKTRGYSHGNLKAGNVFLAGKPQALRTNPIHLADAFPAASLQLSRLEGQDRTTAEKLLREAIELQDLRALGELILQLVEGRLVRSGCDYNYPIARSLAWDNLGPDGEHWRIICNQLLDPHLSPDKISLENLGEQFKDRPAWANLPAILAVAGIISLIAGTLFFAGRERTPTIARQPQNATLESGTNARFTVAGRGGGLMYQWWKDGNGIAGATNSNLVVFSVQTNDSGRYQAVIANRIGSVTSAVVRLTVMSPVLTLTVTAHDANRAYGGNNPILAVTIRGLRGGDSITATAHTAAGPNSGAGEYDIVPVLTDPDNKLRNYTVITNIGKLTITPVQLTVTARDANRAHRQNNPFLAVEISGLRRGDNITATSQTSARFDSQAGKYDIVPVLNDPDHKLQNYTVITNRGMLTILPEISKPLLTVTAKSKNRNYGEGNPALAVEISGLRAGDNITATNRTLANVNSEAGEYDLVPVLNDPDNKLRNYTVITNLGRLTITRVPMTVTAQDTNRAYGENNPALAVEINGLRAGDNITATGRTAAGVNSMAGEYDIVPVLNDPNSKLQNYVVVTNRGKLTITRSLPPPGTLANNPPLTNLFEVPGFDFVWIPNLPNGQGAYVETTELSQSQFDRLAKFYGLKPSKKPNSDATTDDDPVNLDYEDAIHLRDFLNNTPVKLGKAEGKFRLPSQQDFLMFSGVRSATATSNPKFDELDRLLSRLTANVKAARPRDVGAGSTNQFGLFNVLGNAWEWCDDQSGAGFEYDSSFGSLLRSHQEVKGLYTGLRFLIVPAP